MALDATPKVVDLALSWQNYSSGLINSPSGFSEHLFNFVINRESANFPLRENYFAVDYDVKLTSLARLYLDFLTEAGSK
jgi:hypothetical protein